MILRLASLFTIAASLAACNMSPKSSYGFRLPDGSIEAGQTVFTEMGCNSCHSVNGKPELREGVEPEMTVLLGGQTARIGTYGELVTSIINPSHKLSRRLPRDLVSDDGVSKMTNYNDVLTVAQLVDLVAFLQDQYDLFMPPPHTYPPYTY